MLTANARTIRRLNKGRISAIIVTWGLTNLSSTAEPVGVGVRDRASAAFVQVCRAAVNGLLTPTLCAGD